jgi:hypothetical protein
MTKDETAERIAKALESIAQSLEDVILTKADHGVLRVISEE